MQVLLVEDDIADVEIIGEELQAEDTRSWTITTVGYLEEAVDYLAGHKVDVVLLDLHLPDGSGLELVKKIRAQAPFVSIIILTSIEDEELALHTMQEGAQDYLSKNEIDHSALVRAIRYAVERQQLQIKLYAAKEQAIELERLKVLAETARAASHEIHNPLSIILGYADLIISKAPEDFPYREDIGEIHQAAKDIHAIVKNMSLVRKYATKPHGETGEEIIDFHEAY